MSEPWNSIEGVVLRGQGVASGCGDKVEPHLKPDEITLQREQVEQR